LEAKVDKAAETELEQDAREMRTAEGGAMGALVRGEEGGSALEAGAKSIENVKGGEMLMEALDLVEAELPNYAEEEDASRARAGSKQHRNPLLLGLTPYKYLLRALRSIKAPDLEQALLVLPFHYVCRLIRSLIEVSSPLIRRLSFLFFAILNLHSELSASWLGGASTLSYARAAPCICCGATGPRCCTRTSCWRRCWR
jgi:hypothetical protein